jgi:hypothetical protein
MGAEYAGRLLGGLADITRSEFLQRMQAEDIELMVV